MKVVQDYEAPLHLLVEAIGSDPILTVRILRAVNSPLFAVERNVTSLRVAVNLLGARTIGEIVISYAVADTFNQKSMNSIFEQKLWHHSVAVAVTAREICAAVRRRNEVDTAFLCGLLQNIGVLWLLRHDWCYTHFLSDFSTEENMLQLEREAYGSTHAQIGATIAKRWGLAGEIIDVIQNHHHPRQSKNHYVLSLVINAADALVNKNGLGIYDIKGEVPEAHESFTALGLSDEKLDEIWTNTEEALDEMLELLTTLL
jgi:putative nucleotidyltransferase with HDIG domain